MSPLLQILFGKLKAFLTHASTLVATSPHLLTSIERCVLELHGSTCQDEPEITNLQVMEVLSDATLNLLTRYPRPITAENINTILTAAFTLVISQFYGEDTIPNASAKHIFQKYLGIPSLELSEKTRVFCNALAFAIGLQRTSNGDLKPFASSPIEEQELRAFMTLKLLEKSLLRFLSPPTSPDNNFPHQYAYVVYELPNALQNSFVSTTLIGTLSSVSGVRMMREFRLMLAAQPRSDAMTHLIQRLLYLNIEKLILNYADALALSPFATQDVLPQDLLPALIQDLLDDEGNSLLELFLQQHDVKFTELCKELLQQHGHFHYLVALKRMRANVFTETILTFYPHQHAYQITLMERVSSQKIAAELPWFELKRELYQQEPAPAAQNLLDSIVYFANRRFSLLSAYRHLATQGALHSFASHIPTKLLHTASRSAAAELLKALNERILLERHDPQIMPTLNTRIQHLMHHKGMNVIKLSRLLQSAFWQACEYHPAIGYELLLRAYIINLLNEVHDCKKWERNTQALALDMINQWYQYNPFTFRIDDFLSYFDQFLEHPSRGERMELHNPHQYDLVALQTQICLWQPHFSAEQALPASVAGLAIAPGG